MRDDAGNKFFKKRKKNKALRAMVRILDFILTRWKASEVVGFLPHSRDRIGEAQCWRTGGRWRPYCDISDNKYSLLRAAERWGWIEVKRFGKQVFH